MNQIIHIINAMQSKGNLGSRHKINQNMQTIKHIFIENLREKKGKKYYQINNFTGKLWRDMHKMHKESLGRNTPENILINTLVSTSKKYNKDQNSNTVAALDHLDR